tara:strand:+ start:5439 stop:6674 length:1236 start_codon:yes stop_codon:yes gene_type:complete
MSNLYIKFIIIISAFYISACSINSVTDLIPGFPGEAEEDNEIVIRELPDESFDPEDTIEIVSDQNSEGEVEIIQSTDQEVTSIDNILQEDESDNINSLQRARANVPSVLTYVGERIIEMRQEYDSLVSAVTDSDNGFIKLREQGIASAEVYHSTVAAISARLQIGTTPGNPVLLDQYEKAQTELAEVGAQGQIIVDLGNKIALLSTRVSYLMDQTRSAKRLRGAVDEDHRRLSLLQDDLKRKSVEITRLLENLNETVRRRDIYLAAERRRLTLLASAISVGESFGMGLGSIKSLPVDTDNNNLEKKSDANLSGNPIAVIRIDGSSNKFTQGLFGAVSAALDRAPNATFTLVAVSSSAGNASEKAQRAAYAREDAGKVVSSLISMGMPADRLSVTELALAEVENTEVRLYAD